MIFAKAIIDETKIKDIYDKVVVSKESMNFDDMLLSKDGTTAGTRNDRVSVRGIDTEATQFPTRVGDISLLGIDVLKEGSIEDESELSEAEEIVNTYLNGNISSAQKKINGNMRMFSDCITVLKEWGMEGEIPTFQRLMTESKLQRKADTELKIGDELNDGIVFSINPDGKSGLIAMKNDLQGEYNWKDAVIACEQLGNGYRLPSKHELNLLYQQRNAVGGFAKVGYWSSTEYDRYFAWYQGFGSGSQDDYDKDYTMCVRAVKTFSV